MLSETDLHRITGYLYVASGENVVSVTLGEKLYDRNAKERRDVDVTVVTAGLIGLLAVEVKHHKRKLDVIAVEQLCAKLNDMPKVATRAIVSTSGFTTPALSKAVANGVACLKLVKGHIPPMPGIDISRLHQLTHIEKSWLAPPAVSIGPTIILTEDEKSQIGPNTPVHLGNGESTTFKDLADQIARQADPGTAVFEESDQQLLEIIAPFDQPVHVAFATRVVAFPDALVRGVACRTVQQLPLEAACYLADTNNQPFAAAVLFDVKGTLFGMAAAPSGRILRIFQIPSNVRRRKPLNHQIFGPKTA